MRGIDANAAPHPVSGWDRPGQVADALVVDLENDPHELKNVYGDPDYADVAEELLDQLDCLQREFGDTAG